MNIFMGWVFRTHVTLPQADVGSVLTGEMLEMSTVAGGVG